MECDVTSPLARSSLDAKRERALAGDRAAEAALFEDLRVRFLILGKRRVRPDHVEDVVHEALGVVLRKYRDLPSDRGLLVWSMTVLRNVIGNHYQARRRDGDRTTRLDDWDDVAVGQLDDDPLGHLAADEAADRLEAAIDELARTSPRCGIIFARLLESVEQGGSPREVSARTLALVQAALPDLSRNAFYVSLHRCRAQLRAVLNRQEGPRG